MAKGRQHPDDRDRRLAGFLAGPLGIAYERWLDTRPGRALMELRPEERIREAFSAGWLGGMAYMVERVQGEHDGAIGPAATEHQPAGIVIPSERARIEANEWARRAGRPVPYPELDG